MTSLLLRGRVPGGTAAAADRRYDAIRERDPRVAYHGRVVRTEGWVVLHYLFFYAMNDWRSTFDGANDHEADWEQCFVVLEELEDGTTQPAWFCAAAHDEKGDDLRRRWDDPRLEPIDGHPSSTRAPARTRPTSSAANTSCGCRSPASGTCAARSTSSAGSGATRSTSPTRATCPGSVRRALSVPFVDYARGDGVTVGPGCRARVDADPRSRTRTPGSTATAACGASTPATGSPASGRRPARSTPGPGRSASRGTTRSGSPASRRSRRRPGPPTSWPRDLVALEAGALRRARSRRRRSPPSCPAGARSWQRCAASRGSGGISTSGPRRIHADEARLAALRTRDVELTRVLAAGEARLTALRAGVRDDPRAHLRHAAEPEPQSLVRRRAFGEAWAALSVGMLIVLLAVVVWLRILPAVVALPVLLGRLPRRRGVLRPLGRDPAAADRDVPRDRRRDHPGRDVRPRAGPARPAWASASC